MKRYLVLSLLFLSLAASAQPTTVRMRSLEGYFILNDRFLERKVNCMVVSDRREFVKLFGLMNRPDTPDFSKEILLVLALSPGKKQSEISLEKVLMKTGDFMEVYCGLRLDRFPVTYKAYPIVTGVVPRFPGLKTINFYNEKGMKLIASVPIDH